ncbi:MAG: pantoate--beta-alanine ligase [Limisphaerales bacterium]
MRRLKNIKTVPSVAAMQTLGRKWQGERLPVAFVPTMGYLHRGHFSLMERARQLVGPLGKVVVSVYVNPTQFGRNEDLAKYPRSLARDKQLCIEAGVDVLFVPSDAGMYPDDFSTYVVEEALSRSMEGASRPTHFRGVATVVAKLFHIVLPTVAVFGAKDFQQAALIQRMARDLNFPVKVVVAPTVREADGLALSSRNKYLSEPQRAQAIILWRAIQQTKASLKARSAISAARLKEELRALVQTQPEARLDYVEFFDPVTLAPAPKVTKGVQMALAVFIGKTRLIDNAAL